MSNCGFPLPDETSVNVDVDEGWAPLFKGKGLKYNRRNQGDWFVYSLKKKRETWSAARILR